MSPIHAKAPAALLQGSAAWAASMRGEHPCRTGSPKRSRRPACSAASSTANGGGGSRGRVPVFRMAEPGGRAASSWAACGDRISLPSLGRDSRRGCAAGAAAPAVCSATCCATCSACSTLPRLSGVSGTCPRGCASGTTATRCCCWPPVAAAAALVRAGAVLAVAPVRARPAPARLAAGGRLAEGPCFALPFCMSAGGTLERTCRSYCLILLYLQWSEAKKGAALLDQRALSLWFCQAMSAQALPRVVSAASRLMRLRAGVQSAASAVGLLPSLPVLDVVQVDESVTTGGRDRRSGRARTGSHGTSGGTATGGGAAALDAAVLACSAVQDAECSQVGHRLLQKPVVAQAAASWNPGYDGKPHMLRACSSCMLQHLLLTKHQIQSPATRALTAHDRCARPGRHSRQGPGAADALQPRRLSTRRRQPAQVAGPCGAAAARRGRQARGPAAPAACLQAAGRPLRAGRRLRQAGAYGARGWALSCHLVLHRLHMRTNRSPRRALRCIQHPS